MCVFIGFYMSARVHVQNIWGATCMQSGPWFNVKIISCYGLGVGGWGWGWWGCFHYKVETVMRPSYLYNGNHLTCKIATLYCNLQLMTTVYSLWFQTGILTHRGQVTHICTSKITSIGLDNGLSPGRSEAIIWTSAEILLIGTLGTNFSEISIEIYTFSFKKMHLKRRLETGGHFAILKCICFVSYWGYFTRNHMAIQYTTVHW